jgi:hypothetical protein
MQYKHVQVKCETICFLTQGAALIFMGTSDKALNELALGNGVDHPWH